MHYWQHALRAPRYRHDLLYLDDDTGIEAARNAILCGHGLLLSRYYPQPPHYLTCGFVDLLVSQWAARGSDELLEVLQIEHWVNPKVRWQVQLV